MSGAHWGDRHTSPHVHTQLQRLARVLSGVPQLRLVNHEDVPGGRCARWVLLTEDIAGLTHQERKEKIRELNEANWRLEA